MKHGDIVRYTKLGQNVLCLYIKDTGRIASENEHRVLQIIAEPDDGAMWSRDTKQGLEKDCEVLGNIFEAILENLNEQR